MPEIKLTLNPTPAAEPAVETASPAAQTAVETPAAPEAIPFCTPDVSILVSIMTEPSAAMCPPPNYLRFNISFSLSL